MDSAAGMLVGQLEARGYRARIVAAGHLADLQEGIERWRREGLLDAEVDRAYLRELRFSPPEGLADARSLIIVADPKPPVGLRFNWQGRAVPAIMPRAYVHQALEKALLALLQEILGPAGYRVEPVNAPVKLLAACSGLGRYGRNNVCYVPGLGSFPRLMAYCSDLPCTEDTWQAPAMLEACARCSACRRACPTGAIGSDRFLVHAERCLTWYNERPGTLPEWIEPAWHNALVGCQRCQRICPVNREFLDWVEPGPEFSEEETALLLGGAPAVKFSEETVAKLATVDLATGDVEILARNLGLLIAQGEDTHG